MRQRCVSALMVLTHGFVDAWVFMLCICAHTCTTLVADTALSHTEKRVAFNLFSALDAKHQKKLDNSEFGRLLQGVRAGLDAKKYGALLEAISRSTYFYTDDLNKDKYIEFNEFMKAITSIKNRDPKDFGAFLKAAKKIKPLHSGSVCRPNGTGDACPRKQTCQLKVKGTGSPYTIVRDGIKPRQLAAKTTTPIRRPGGT